MGESLKKAMEYEKKIKVSVESGDDVGAEQNLSKLECVYGRAGRSKNKKDKSDTPYIHGIVKSIQQLVDEMKKKKT